MKALLSVVAALALCGAASPALAFDAGDPAAVLGVLTAMGAKGEVKHSGDLTAIDGMADQTAFAVEFQDCSATRVGCKTLVYRTVWKVDKAPTLVQMNGWNLGSTFCPAVLTKDGYPGVSYSVRTNPAMTADDVRDQFNIYLSCLQGFSEFGPDPDAFLKKYGRGGDPSPPAQPAPGPGSPKR